MRVLNDYEEVGLIGYPDDGDYLVMLDEKDKTSRILGGERCGHLGADVAVQAAALPRYYPVKSHLAVARVEGNRLLSMRDYRTGEQLQMHS
jgi:hypothetical protein